MTRRAWITAGAGMSLRDIGAYELVKCKGVVVNVVGPAKKDKLDGGPGKDKEVQ